jgi:hypothetical protein
MLMGTPDTLTDRLARLDSFTDQWDTRQGLERNLAPDLALSAEQEGLILEAATALGLREVGIPRHTSYDHVVMLGGLFRACIARPAYAAKLIRHGVVEAAEVTALGGHRPFAGDEFKLAEEGGFPGLTEEYEALDAGTRSAFALGEPTTAEGEVSDLVGGTWGMRTYRDTNGLPVSVAAAPSSDPEIRRANTADSYLWFAERLALLQPGQRLLSVTTAIYVPAQHAAALRMLTLPYGVDVDTVGIEPGQVVPSLAQTFSATKYLLEIRSAIRSLRQLLAAVNSLDR